MEERELKVESPCHMRWAELKGTGSKRWCDQCSLHVVDSQSLTARQAEELVDTASGRVCMRVVYDETGKPLHAPEPAREPASALGQTRMGRALRYGLTAAAGVLAACTDSRPERASEPTEPAQPDATGPATDRPMERPPEIMGEVCFPEPMTPTQELEAMGGMRLEALGRVAGPDPSIPEGDT